MLKNESEETKQQEPVVYGKFYSDDSIKKPSHQKSPAEADETNIETCKEEVGDSDCLSSKPPQSHSSLLSYYRHADGSGGKEREESKDQSDL